MQHLEKKAVKATEKSSSLQSEYERLRSLRVDDALLIERLRTQQNEIRDSINELIGALAAFTSSLGSVDQELKEQILRIRPLRRAEDITDGMKDVRQCITNIIIHAKNQAEALLNNRDDSRELSPPQKESS